MTTKPKPPLNLRAKIDESNKRLREVLADADHTPEEFCRAARGAFVEHTVTLDKRNIDEDARTVELAFSSETPYERYWGVEILGHRNDEIRLSRLLSGGPLLAEHDSNRHIGVVESGQLDSDRVARALVRFGKGGEASEIFNDVADGIRRNVSVGYEIHELEMVSEDDGVRTYRATDWEPYEISIVSMPADVTVGVGRESEPQTYTGNQVERLLNVIEKEARQMSTESNTPDTPAEKPAPAVDINAVRETALRDERNRVNLINELGAKHDAGELAAKCIQNGTSGDEFRVSLLEELARRDKATVVSAGSPEIGMSEKEVKRFSFVKAIRALANPNVRSLQNDAAFELECSEAAAKHLGRSTQGIIVPSNERWDGSEETIMQRATVPHDVLSRGRMHQRDLVTTTANIGGDLVGTDIQGQAFIDVLRNSTVVAGLGATILGDLNGNVAIPRKTSTTTGFWVADNTAPTETTQNFDQVTGTPHTVATYTDFSRQLMLQSSVDVENMVRTDLAESLAVTIDLAALYGSGSGAEPQGIATASGVNTPTAFAATVPTWAEITAMIGTTAAANALRGGAAFIINPADMGSLMATTKDTGSGQFIYDNGMIAGYPAPHTSNVTLGDVFFSGSWSELIMFMWGGLDLLVDPFTGSAARTTRVVAHQSIDIGLRHPASFTFNNDT